MAKNPLFAFAFAFVGWPAVVIIALTGRVLTAGSAPGTPEYVGWLLLASMPPVTGWLIARGRPSRSVAQILYDTEHSEAPGEKAAVRVPRG